MTDLDARPAFQTDHATVSSTPTPERACTRVRLGQPAYAVVALPQITGWHGYAATRAALARALASAADTRSAGVIVDLTNTILVDTSGLVLLACLHARAACSGTAIRLVVPTMCLPVRHVLRTTGLAGLMQVFPCLEGAMSAPPEARRPDPPSATQRVLDRIHALRTSGPEPPGREDLHRDRPRLAITLKAELDHMRVTLSGALDPMTIKRVGEMLTSLADMNMHHLVLVLPEEQPVRGDFLPMLLGIRWRVAAQGGCLTVPVMPVRLRHFLHREGLEHIFGPCGLVHASSLGSSVR